MAEHKNNDRINNIQRKELVKLAAEALDRKIQQARDESGELVTQIREQVREELGIATIDNQIDAMEKQIAILKQKREQLGFSSYQDSLVQGSQAKMLVDKRSGAACGKVSELESMKMDSISGIWTAATLTQALSILNNVRGL